MNDPRFSHLTLLGIDVSKATFDAHLVQGTQTHSAQFANHPEGFAQCEAWLTAHGAPQTLAGLEATGPYGMQLLWHLHSAGHVVCLLNPRHVKDYGRSQGRRIKTDRSDAALIVAHLKACERLRPWQPPTQMLVELQAMVRRRQQLQNAQQAERNRLDSVHTTVVAASLQRQIQQLKTELAVLDKAIDQLVLQHRELQHSVRLLRSIPGIGRMVAVTILAEVPALSAFNRARDVAAFAGLTPCVVQSGTSVRRKGRLTKEGSALLRKMLYMAALQAAGRPTNALHHSYKAFVARGKSKMCALGAIMHKLIRIAFGVLKHNHPFVENFARI